MSVRPRGSAWMIVAALSFALMSWFAAAGSGAISATEVLFYRTFIGLLFLAPLMLWRREPLRSPHWFAHGKRSVFGYVAMLLLFYALAHLPLATAVTLNYTSSLFFALCCVALRSEHLPRAVWLALLLGFAGIVCLLRPTFDSGQWLAGLLGFASGMLAGLALFHVRELGELGERPAVTVFWLYVVSTVLGLVLVLANGGFHALDLRHVLLMTGVGVMGLAGQLAMTHAYKVGRKFVVSSLAYLTVVFSALFGWLLNGQQLPWLAWLGMVLVIASGVLVARR